MLQVNDESTSELMERLYRHLMDGHTTVAQALRLAMLHLLRHPPSPHWRRPKYWAGFLVVGATTRLRCTTRFSEGWTVEDVCTFVRGLRQEFGDQASVYAAAMKEQAIDGEALLDLSVANPIADNKLKELGVKIGHRMKLKSCIQGLQLASRVPPSSRASPETPSRCTAPSAHPPQVMLRGWEYDHLLLPLPASLARSGARSFPPSFSISLSLSLSLSVCVCVCVCVCVFC